MREWERTGRGTTEVAGIALEGEMEVSGRRWKRLGGDSEVPNKQTD